MVYCGKPSRGCQMCRTRRIKCDETKPTCNQCVKSRRVCPGYKDEFDLVFRNETQATERRARKTTRKARINQLNEVSAYHEDSMQAFNPLSSSFDVTAVLHFPVREQASCHFISNYVLIPRQGCTRGYMEYILPLLNSEGDAPHFRQAFDACAYASLGNRVGPGNDLESKALGAYTKALSLTFSALKDPNLMKQDSTLASILLLGLFENITAKQIGMLAWGSHIEGAIQLVKARGRKQLRTKSGLLLFIAVRTQMIIHTLSSGTTPVMGIEWWFTDAVKDENASKCQQLNMRAAELRAEVNRMMASTIRGHEHTELMLDLIRKCQAVDQECVSWTQNLPDHFRWETLAWEDHVPQGDYHKADVYPGRVDAYQDIWIASVWNMIRCSRVVLASLIVRCAAWVCSPVDYRTTPEYATAARTCVDTITDILASVPYQLGWFASRKGLLEKSTLSGFGCGEEDAPKGLPGYFLTWPLSCVHSQDYATDSQRAWVKGRLLYIANHRGIRYANMLAQLNISIPSMLIRRDGLMASPYPMAHDFVGILSGKTALPAPGSTMNPMQQYDAMQKERVNKGNAELLSKAVGTSGKADEFTARSWLQMKNGAATIVQRGSS